MLCLSCLRWSPSGSPFCSGCSRSFGARYCGAKKRHANALNAQFCAQCGSQKLTDPALYLPVGWLLRGFVVVGLFFAARKVWPFVWPVIERHFCALINALCPLISIFLNWVVSAAMLYFVLWVLTSLLPDEFSKPLQNAMRSVVNLLRRTLRELLRSVFRLLRRVVAGKTKPQST